MKTNKFVYDRSPKAYVTKAKKWTGMYMKRWELGNSRSLSSLLQCAYLAGSNEVLKVWISRVEVPTKRRLYLEK